MDDTNQVTLEELAMFFISLTAIVIDISTTAHFVKKPVVVLMK